MFLAKEDDTVTQKEEKADKQTPHPDSRTSSVEAVAVSIYLDDGLSEEPKPSKTPQPQRRLTMVSTRNVSLVVEVSLIGGFSPGRPPMWRGYKANLHCHGDY